MTKGLTSIGFLLAGARQLLFYCPWCGEKLPPSQRDRWYDELEARDINPNEDTIPSEFQSAQWRGGRKPTELGPERGGPIEGRVINVFEFDGDE